ncbi:Hypothetical protein NGAL_HAMBI2566_48040 [Neorhizobium galegae bv. orientalis]|nr:Hypothetical protein NGAL_HAMBI2566_48040 [Neorhizobium galegae bv. orientalis]
MIALFSSNSFPPLRGARHGSPLSTPSRRQVFPNLNWREINDMIVMTIMVSSKAASAFQWGLAWPI